MLWNLLLGLVVSGRGAAQQLSAADRLSAVAAVATHARYNFAGWDRVRADWDSALRATLVQAVPRQTDLQFLRRLRRLLLERFNEILDRRWLSNGGPCVQQLERKLEKLLGVRNCIVMCNATIALDLASRALELKGEVIVPSFTFIATAHALQWQGITPVFCDVDPKTHNLDPERVEELITPRTIGILGVHVWGRPCAVEKLADIARRHHLKVMYDSALAFGCSHQGTMAGNFGKLEVFSFHATKFFNTFEGGAVVTNNDELAARIRLMTNFGFKNYDTVIYLDTNAKMNEFSAAVGLTGLDALGL